MPSGVSYLADSILYLVSLIADQPRPIDRYIDYFGESRGVGAVGRARSIDGRTGR